MHADRLHPHLGARLLREEGEGDGFLRLNADAQLIGAEPAHLGQLAEEADRRLAEDDGDLGDGLGHALARAEVERHALPAPVLDVEAHSDEGLGVRGVAHVGLVAVAARDLVAQRAGRVLASDNGPRVDGWDRLEQLGFLVADRFGAEGGGGSIVSSDRIWKTWFCMMSRRAPTSS